MAQKTKTSYLSALLGQSDPKVHSPTPKVHNPIPKVHNPTPKVHPPMFSILKHDETYYQYVGSYHKTANEEGLEKGDKIEAGSMYVTDYDPTDVDYMYVRAIIKHDDDRYYLLPSMYSEVGTWDPTIREYTVVEKSLPYRIKYMSEKTSEQKYPHLLD